MRGIYRELARHGRGEIMLVKVNPEIARQLYDFGSRDLEMIEERLEIKIVIRPKDGLEPGAFEIERATAAA
jgi:ribosomal protein L31E